MEKTPKGCSEDPASLDNQISSTDKFYKELDEKLLSFKFPDNEIKELAAAVKEVVRTIVNRLGLIDDRFKCTEVISVGSFEEGARILEPNEFDFLAVVEELSQPNAVQPIRVCEKNRGFMHVKVCDEALQKRWLDYMDNGDLLSFAIRSSNPDTESLSFCSLIWRIFRDESPIVVTKPSGTMKFAGVSIFREPNTVIVMTWKNPHRDDVYKITADLSPVILCHDVSKVITQNDCPYEHLYVEVQECGRFVLVPGRSSNLNGLSKCFNISVTEVEVSLVRSLGVTHKRCYRVLKYLLCNVCHELGFKGFVYLNLSSYIVKSAILHHAADGQCEGDSLNSCVQNVLYSLLNCLMKDRPYLPFMPSAFVREHNLFDDLIIYQTSKSSATRLVMHVQCLMSVLFLHQKLHALPLSEYDYEKCMEFLEQMTQQLKKAKANIAILQRQFCDDDGKWNAVEMSTKDLLRKFGIPHKIVNSDTIKEEEEVE